jgi:hypothetical protein
MAVTQPLEVALRNGMEREIDTIITLDVSMHSPIEPI